MFAVIRIQSFYSWLRHLSPLVRRSTYLAMAEVAADCHDRYTGARGALKDAQAAYSHSITGFREQHEADVKLVNELNAKAETAQRRVTDLMETADNLRRKLQEESERCGRLAQLLRDVRESTDPARIQQAVIES